MVSQTVAEPCPSGPDDTVSRETNIDPRHRGQRGGFEVPERMGGFAERNVMERLNVRQVTAA